MGLSAGGVWETVRYRCTWSWPDPWGLWLEVWPQASLACRWWHDQSTAQGKNRRARTEPAGARIFRHAPEEAGAARGMDGLGRAGAAGGGPGMGVPRRTGAAQGGGRVQSTGPHPAEKDRADQGHPVIPLNAFVGGEKGVGLFQQGKERSRSMNKFIRSHKELYLGHGSSRERGAGSCGAIRQVGTHCEPPWVKGLDLPDLPEPAGSCRGIRWGRAWDAALRPDSQRVGAEVHGGRVGRS